MYSAAVLLCAGVTLNPRDEASSFSIANVDVVDTACLQETFHRAFNFSRRRAFPSNNPAVFAIGFQSERKRSQLFREDLRLVIAGARFGVNEDRSRRRVFIEALEWV